MTEGTGGEPGIGCCAEHGSASDIGAELRALADLLAHRLQPWVEQLRAGSDGPGAPEPATCTWCPVCAALALLRGERPELAARLAEHGVGLLAALRELLAATPNCEPGGDQEQQSGKPVVQRVTVRRPDGQREAGPEC